MTGPQEKPSGYVISKGRGMKQGRGKGGREKGREGGKRAYIEERQYQSGWKMERGWRQQLEGRGGALGGRD